MLFSLLISSTVAINNPPDRDHLIVQLLMANGFEENGESVRPLIKEDTEFVYRKEDLITLQPGQESAWLDAIVERALKMIHCAPIKVFFSYSISCMTIS